MSQGMAAAGQGLLQVLAGKLELGGEALFALGAELHQSGSLEAALPGMPIVTQAESTAFLNAPVAYVLHVIDQDWAAGLISAGAVAGITSVLLVMLGGRDRWWDAHAILDQAFAHAADAR